MSVRVQVCVCARVSPWNSASWLLVAMWLVWDVGMRASGWVVWFVLLGVCVFVCVCVCA